jgi:serine acetyltransferase
MLRISESATKITQGAATVSIKKLSFQLIGALTVLALSMGLNVAPAAAADITTINGVVYTMDGAGAAYVSGYTGDLPANLSVESSVTIGGSSYSVTSIGDFAIAGATSLVSVSIPDSVTSIGHDAFNGNSSLVSVSFGKSITSIGDLAFFNASSLVAVQIPDSVTSIGYGAFAGESSMASLVYGSSMTSIGNYAFLNASSLVSLSIPDSVTSIGNYAFAGSYSLASVTIPDSVTSIGQNAFSGASALRVITFNGGAPTMGKDALDGDPATVYFYSRFGSEAVTGGFTSPTWKNVSAVALEGTLTLTPTPQIFGEAKVGQTLTAAPLSWNTGVSFSYQWYRGGSLITDATGANYLLTSTDGGAIFTVKVTGAKPGFPAVSKTSAATAFVAPEFASLRKTPTPTISGTPKVGKKLTAKAGVWDAGVKLAYNWYRSGIAIKGASKASYKLAKADSGKKITVSVTATKVGFQGVSKASKATGKVKR